MQVQTESGGPTSGKPIDLQIRARDPATQAAAVEAALATMGRIGDVTDTRPLPEVEVSILVDREEAARHGADVGLLGQAVQLPTQGITVADYRPTDVDGAIDIRVRFPREDRSMAEPDGLRVSTAAGLVPISNFVTIAPSERVGTLRREDERRVVTIQASVAPGLLVDDQVTALQSALDAVDLPKGVSDTFAGDAEDQAESMAFLVSAFQPAIFSMLVILVAQFNGSFQAIVVMSAIVSSIAGVLRGLLVTGRPFGVVMAASE